MLNLFIALLTLSAAFANQITAIERIASAFGHSSQAAGTLVREFREFSAGSCHVSTYYFSRDNGDATWVSVILYILKPGTDLIEQRAEFGIHFETNTATKLELSKDSLLVRTTNNFENGDISLSYLRVNQGASGLSVEVNDGTKTLKCGPLKFLGQ